MATLVLPLLPFGTISYASIYIKQLLCSLVEFWDYLLGYRRRTGRTASGTYQQPKPCTPFAVKTSYAAISPKLNMTICAEAELLPATGTHAAAGRLPAAQLPTTTGCPPSAAGAPPSSGRRGPPTICRPLQGEDSLQHDAPIVSTAFASSVAALSTPEANRLAVQVTLTGRAYITRRMRCCMYLTTTLNIVIGCMMQDPFAPAFVDDFSFPAELGKLWGPGPFRCWHGRFRANELASWQLPGYFTGRTATAPCSLVEYVVRACQTVCDPLRGQLF